MTDKVSTAGEVVAEYLIDHPPAAEPTVLASIRQLQPPGSLDLESVRGLTTWLASSTEGGTLRPQISISQLRQSHPVLSLLCEVCDVPGGRAVAAAMRFITEEACDLEAEAANGDVLYRDSLSFRQILCTLGASNALPPVAAATNAVNARLVLSRLVHLIPSSDLSQVPNAADKVEAVLDIICGARTFGAAQRRVDRRADNVTTAEKIDARSMRQEFRAARLTSGTGTLYQDFSHCFTLEVEQPSDVTRLKVRPSFASKREVNFRAGIEREARLISSALSPSDPLALPIELVGKSVGSVLGRCVDQHLQAWLALPLQLPLPPARLKSIVQANAAPTHGGNDIVLTLDDGVQFELRGLADNSRDRFIVVRLPKRMYSALWTSLQVATAEEWVERAQRFWSRHSPIGSLTVIQGAIRRWHALHGGLDAIDRQLIAGELDVPGRIAMTYRRRSLSEFQARFAAKMSRLAECLGGPAWESGLELFQVPIEGSHGFVGSPIELPETEIQARRQELRDALRSTRSPMPLKKLLPKQIFERLNAAAAVVRFEILLLVGMRPLGQSSQISLVRTSSGVTIHCFDKETYTSATTREVPLDEGTFEFLKNYLVDWVEGVVALVAHHKPTSELDALRSCYESFLAGTPGIWLIPLELRDLVVATSGRLQEGDRGPWMNPSRPYPPNAPRHGFATRHDGTTADANIEDWLGHNLPVGLSDRLSSVCRSEQAPRHVLGPPRIVRLWRSS